MNAGIEGFTALYADKVPGSYNQTFVRSPNHLLACPTDQQAEVLVADQIELQDILAVAVPDEAQARRERVALRTNSLDPDAFKFIVAPHLFRKHDLNNVIRFGLRPSEVELSFGLTSGGEL